MRWVGILLLAACGRIDFAPLADSAPADATTPLGPWSVPEPVAELATPSFEDDPSLTGDMLEIYFNSMAGGDGDIWFATRPSVAEPFGTAARVVELNSTAMDTTPEVSTDGLTIYFASDRAPSFGSFDIWFSTRASRTSLWSVPVRVPELSSAFADESPCVDAAGTTIYFDSTRLSDPVDKIFTATRADAAAMWPTPVVAAGFDGMYEEENPFLDANGLVVWISVDVPVSGFDIYSASRATPSSPFEPPRSEDALNTTPTDDVDPWLSPDGRTIYFASTRAGTGDSDIYSATR